MSRNTENFVDLHTGLDTLINNTLCTARESIRSKSVLALYQYLYCRGRGWRRVMNRREKAMREKKGYQEYSRQYRIGIKSNQTYIIIHTTYIYTLLICLSVCLYPINVKRLNLSGQNFVWDLTWPQGRFMDDQNIKISLQQNSILII